MRKFTRIEDRMRHSTFQPEFLQEHKEVNQYFDTCMEKVFVARMNYSIHQWRIKTFQEYLEKGYTDSCYYYSGYGIMGLTNSDYIVRGKIDVDEQNWCHYKHGWIEFTFNGQEYIFDSLNGSIVEKQLYYERMQPQVTYKETLAEVLKTFTSPENSEEIADGIYKVKSFDLVYNSNNIDPSHLFLPYSAAVIEMDKEKQLVKRFTGYR